jgi:hypothetical protein
VWRFAVKLRPGDGSGGSGDDRGSSPKQRLGAEGFGLVGQQGSLSSKIVSRLSKIGHGALLFIGSLLLILCGSRALFRSGVRFDL